ncbi:hypothetical protein BMAPRL20_0640 [Burkholderia mallei PRL-20]|nr:hypothetical protein BMA10247_A1731 [Burkholderia mallei NCTC 10247]EDK57407.1 hypothetical protein BMAJHU_F0157 [Burkholderia mallei JHU]EDK82765.1 hypothetical protein BMA721280_K0165 [Burkholderia mallei 2002721280]EEP88590.1 conserved hypothetical protein [Burkholderia mallei GB8 horse 4]EES42717.1 hypothetical protein BMAPRL20_0640 [Burkholderia mallei PRL-20]
MYPVRDGARASRDACAPLRSGCRRAAPRDAGRRAGIARAAFSACSFSRRAVRRRAS